MKCLKCNCTDWVWANIGLSNIVQCTNCGYLYHYYNDWPFPAKCPPEPWTPEQQRKYAEEQLKKLPESPL